MWGLGWVRKVRFKRNEVGTKRFLKEGNVDSGIVAGCAVLLEASERKGFRTWQNLLKAPYAKQETFNRTIRCYDYLLMMAFRK